LTVLPFERVFHLFGWLLMASFDSTSSASISETAISFASSVSASVTAETVAEDEPVQIIDYLYLGDRRSAKNKEVLQALGITHIVNVTLARGDGGVHNFFEDTPPFEYHRVPIQDSDGADILPFLSAAFAFIDEAREKGHSVLIHCQQGVSRSPTLVIAYLMKKMGLKLAQAYSLLRRKRAQVKPKGNFLQQLMTFEKSLAKMIASVSSLSSSSSPVMSSSSLSSSSSSSVTPISVPHKRKLAEAPSDEETLVLGKPSLRPPSVSPPPLRTPSPAERLAAMVSQGVLSPTIDPKKRKLLSVSYTSSSTSSAGDFSLDDDEDGALAARRARRYATEIALVSLSNSSSAGPFTAATVATPAIPHEAPSSVA
jgi:protein-tyrosine phosphatase